MLMLNILFIAFVFRRMRDIDLSEGAKRHG
jgi:hypothetical protein